MTTRQITKEAEELRAKAEQAVQEAAEGFTMIAQDPPEWRDFIPSKKKELRAQRISEGSGLIRKEFEKVIGEIDETTAEYRTEIYKAVRPLSTSPVQSDIQRAQFFDQQARDIVRAVGLQGLPAEYAEAMKYGHTELGTALIDWSERLMDQDDPRDQEAFMLTKEKHIETLGFKPLVHSIAALETSKKDLQMRLEMLKNGLPPDFTQASGPEELGRALISSGITTDATW